jgi:hypothetical protein
MRSSAQYFEYIICATQELRRKLANPQTLDEGDLFLSCLIALSTVEPTSAPNLYGFIAVMRHLNDRVGGALEKYDYKIFWALARDVLGFRMATSAGETLEYWSASGQVLGSPTIEMVASYSSPFDEAGDSCSKAAINQHVRHLTAYILQTLLVQYLELKALVRRIMRQSHDSRYPLPSTSLNRSIYDDHLATESEKVFLDRVLKGSERSWTPESVTSDHEMVFQSTYSMSVFSSYVILCIRLNRLLRNLLRAPSIIEGLISQEGLEAGARVVEWLRDRSGGSFWLAWKDPEGSFEAYLVCLTYLLPGETRKFINGTYHVVIHLTY